MAKPRLVKVRALFYVLQHITKRGYAYFDTAPFFMGMDLLSKNGGEEAHKGFQHALIAGARAPAR